MTQSCERTGGGACNSPKINQVYESLTPTLAGPIEFSILHIGRVSAEATLTYRHQGQECLLILEGAVVDPGRQAILTLARATAWLTLQRSRTRIAARGGAGGRGDGRNPAGVSGSGERTPGRSRPLTRSTSALYYPKEVIL